MNANEKNMDEDWKYKELEEENNRLKAEIKKLGEKSVNELKNLEEEFRKKYKELEEENNRLKVEIIKLQNIQSIKNMIEEKIDNELINEISYPKKEEKDNSINISLNSNKIEKSHSLSSFIYDVINSISLDAIIKEKISYSLLNNHFICLKCKQVPRIEFSDFFQILLI